MSTIARVRFRSTTRDAEQLSAYLRLGSDDNVLGRRRVTALYMWGIASLGVVALYQLGIIKHVPEPRLRFLNADGVDASGEAYVSLAMPDAVLGIASYAVTLTLVAAGGKDRAADNPLLPLAAAGKVLVDAASGAFLTAEQAVRHRAFCSWCLSAAAVSLLAVPNVLPEAHAAAQQLWRILGRGRGTR